MVDKGRWVAGDREDQPARVHLKHRVDANNRGPVSCLDGTIVAYWRDSSGKPSAIVVGEEQQVVVPWDNVAAISDIPGPPDFPSA